MTYAEFRKEQAIAVRKAEVRLLDRALHKARGNVDAAARDLKVSHTGLWERIRVLKLYRRLAVIRSGYGYVPTRCGGSGPTLP